MSETILEMARKEALRQGGLYLENQRIFSLSSDARSINFCAITILASTVIFGLIIDNDYNIFLLIALVSLIMSAVSSAWSARPAWFYGSGGKYNDFEHYLNEHYADRVWVAIAERNDKNIEDNNKAIISSARYFKIALFFASVGGLAVIFYLFKSSGALASLAMLCSK